METIVSSGKDKPRKGASKRRSTVMWRTYRVIVTYPQVDHKGRQVVRHRIMHGLTRGEVIHKCREATKKAGWPKVTISAVQIGGPKPRNLRRKVNKPGSLIDWDAVNGGRTAAVDIDHILGF